MEIFSLVGSILLKDNDTKSKLKDIDNTAKQTSNGFESAFKKISDTASNLGKNVGVAFDNLDKKFQLWMADNKKSASSTEINNKALETYKGKLQALSEELETSKKILEETADGFGKNSTECKEAENHVMDLQLKYKQLEDESKKLQKATDSINFKKIADGAISVGSNLTMKLTTPIIGAFGLAAKSATSFEHQMADIRKEVAASGAPVSQVNSLMSQMSKNSIAWSEDFGQSTEGINEGLLTLVKDGYSADEAMKIMHNSLYAARGANEDLSTTVDGLGSSLEAFGMKTNNASQTVKNMSKLTDAFAYISNHTKGSMSSLSEASSIMGSTFTALKIPMTQAASAIGILQSNGIDASTAANSLKAGLVNLVHPSKQMSAAMEKMHLDVFDAKGQMKDLPTILNEIENGTKGWTDQQKQAAIATVFGKESLSSWNVLVHKGGDYLSDLSTHAGNATGEVKKLSDSMKNTPANKFKELKESVHALAVSFGQDVLPSLMPLVNVATNLIKRFSNLDEGTKKFVVTVLALVAGLGPVILIFGKTLDTIIKLHNNIGLLQQGFTKLGGMSGILSGALKALPFIAIIAGIVAVIAIGYELYKHWDQIKAKAGELKTALLGHLTNIKNSVIAGWNWLKSFMTTWGPVILAVIAPIIGIPILIVQHWTQIKSTLASLWNSLKTSAISIFTGLVNGIKSVFNSIGAFFTGIWNGIVQGVTAFIAPIVSAFQALAQKLIYPFALVSAGIQSIFHGIIQILQAVFIGPLLLFFELVKAIFTGNWEELRVSAIAVWNRLVLGIKNILAGLRAVIEGVLLTIVTVLQTTWSGLASIATTIWTTVKNAVVSVVTSTVNTVKSIWNTIITFFRNLPGTLYSLAVAMFTTFKNGAVAIITAAVNLVKSIWNGIINFFKNLPGTMYNLAVSMFTSLKNGAVKILTLAVQGWKNIFNGLINWFKKLPSTFKTIGVNLIQGMYNGIKDKIKGVVNLAKDLASKLLTAMKNVFGIHSPSKETYSMGGYLIKGLVNALLSGAGNVKAVVGKVFGGAINFAKGIVGSAQVGSWLTMALAESGTSLTWLPALQTLVQKESGGDPTAYNSQSVGGEHATGLMQMLKSTFDSYAASGHGNILNPLDNILSAINYIKSRYGSPYNIPHLFSGNYVGYATGTDNATPGAHPVAENGFEIVLNKAMGLFKGGETVLNNSDSIKFLSSIANLGSNAVTWGADMVQNIATGINSNLGNVKNAALNVANSISRLLHFSVPDEGPLSDVNKWMPDFTQQLAKGLKDNTVYVKNEALKLGTVLADSVMDQRKLRDQYLKSYSSKKITADRALNDLDGANKLLKVSTNDNLKDMQNLLGIMTNESTEIVILTNEYNKLGKQYGYNSDKAQEVSKKLQDLRADYQETGKDVQDLANKIKETQADNINSITDKIKDALKQRYSDEKEAAENQIKLAEDTQTKILQAKIDAISDQETDMSTQDQDEDDAEKRADLERQLSMHYGAEKKKELQEELDDLNKTEERRHAKEALDKQKEDLQKQIDQVKDNSDTMLQNVDDFYDKKLQDANLEAEAEKTLMTNTQSEIISLLHSYGEEYELAGQDLGTRLANGFSSAIQSLKTMLDSIKTSLPDTAVMADTPNSKYAIEGQNLKSVLGLIDSIRNYKPATDTSNSQTPIIITKTYLDGKQIAESTTPYVDNNLGTTSALSGRGL
ncbi:phage tail tape measure protein [Clostridium tyrobutyricum]|uniref:phage tail tape measure protein n=1 Tax=Clostridium tyrobutyricum TaxID=1519 RepID=UPI0018AC48B6|nr:phage tail tape measure protein [Clostridium tyrobutyricum]